MSPVLLTFLLTATAGAAQVEVFDRVTRQTLPAYEHDGRRYVIGEPGHEYELRIRSDAAQRVLAVATVDGVNVITGQTGSVSQSGYVLDPYGFLKVEGWRKSLSHTAAFYFTRLPDSYAARTGRPQNVGVIGVALFHERSYCCRAEERAQSAEPSAAPSMRDRVESNAARKAESSLGTGHGRSEYSAAQYTSFERASDVPEETLVIYYDSRRNLVAQGVIPDHPKLAQRYPQPFPNGFVPDP
jgi:hypothetical protein